jgi:hypothetical protein
MALAAFDCTHILADQPHHVHRAARTGTRRPGADRKKGCERKVAVPFIAGVGRRIIAPGVGAPIGSARRQFPFGFGGQAFARPAGIGFGIGGIDADHGQRFGAGLVRRPGPGPFAPADHPAVSQHLIVGLLHEAGELTACDRIGVDPEVFYFQDFSVRVKLQAIGMHPGGGGGGLLLRRGHAEDQVPTRHADHFAIHPLRGIGAQRRTRGLFLAEPRRHGRQQRPQTQTDDPHRFIFINHRKNLKPET